MCFRAILAPSLVAAVQHRIARGARHRRALGSRLAMAPKAAMKAMKKTAMKKAAAQGAGKKKAAKTAMKKASKAAIKGAAAVAAAALLGVHSTIPNANVYSRPTLTTDSHGRTYALVRSVDHWMEVTPQPKQKAAKKKKGGSNH